MNTGDARTEILHSIRAHLAMSAPSDPSDLSDPPIRAVPCSSVAQLFKQNLEAVDGHCIVVDNQTEVEETVKRLTEGKKIASPDASRADLFKYDVGVTSAQAGIAETGTLVLDSSVERNRLVSLVPPIHIAILDASRIYQTLGETLAALQSGEEISPAITFITGPSRTADIELTLAIGVHGPQELYVIINRNN
ncbi:MAG TPA: lactate utilization protein [Pyrinomonadaceae bacterium]|nr:lactate utilization protein [Pyrinomonadaceae bacterium]